MKINNKSTKDEGAEGERVAERFLREKGYIIREKNYFSNHGEIDIIAEKGDTVIFAEVKMRDKDNTGRYGRPARAVTKSKMQNIIFTAKVYMLKTRCTLAPRFDVIEVYDEDGFYGINHLEGAFTL